MKLHELKPAEGSRKVRNRVMVKLPDVVKKVKKHVAVEKYVLVLKVDKHHCSVVCQNVVFQTLTQKNTHL